MTPQQRPIWQKSIFWGKMRDTFAIIGGPTTAGLVIFQADDGWVLLSGVISMVGSFIGVWFSDSNADGIVDIFQDTNGIDKKR